MAVPKFNPVGSPETPPFYASPDHVPDRWMPDRPGEIDGFQPEGPRLGTQGPDQGYALKIASQLRPKLRLQADEHPDDAVRGCLEVALRRASIFSRAPVVHDLNIAFTIWGFYDPTPPADLLELRRSMFEGLRHVGHHYAESRVVADLVPEASLRLTPQDVDAAYPGSWRTLLGV